MRENRQTLKPAAEDALAPSRMTAEQQKRKLSLQVTAIMSALALPEANRADVRSAYVIAEDLALRRVELEYDFSLARHTVLAGVPFDAAAAKGNEFFLADVSFLAKPEVPQAHLEMLFEKASFAVKRIREARPKAKILLVLILITQLAPVDEENFHKILRKVLQTSAPVEVNAHLFDFAELQQLFLNE